jgi:hypothetical protein
MLRYSNNMQLYMQALYHGDVLFRLHLQTDGPTDRPDERRIKTERPTDELAAATF